MEPSDNSAGVGPVDFTGGSGQLSMDDRMSSAEDNLTSAGNAAETGATDTIGLDQIGASDPSAQMARPEEPLIPAAPVPGSLGSVTSGPAIAQQMAGAMDAPVATPSPAGVGPVAAPGAAGAAVVAAVPGGVGPVVDVAPTVGATAPVASSPVDVTAAPAVDVASPAAMAAPVSPTAGNPVVAGAGAPATPEMAAPGMAAPGATAMAAETQPAMAAMMPPTAPAPYNPFAAPAPTPASDTQTESEDMTSSTKIPDSLKPRKASFSLGGGNKMTMIFGVAAVLFAAAAVVFAILWINEMNKPQPAVSQPAQATVQDPDVPSSQVISCSHEMTPEAVQGVAGLLSGREVVTLEFEDGELANKTSVTTYNFADAAAALAAATLFETRKATDLAMNPEPDMEAPLVTASYETVEQVVNYRRAIKIAESLEQPGMNLALPKDESDSYVTDTDSVEGYYAELGYVCAEVEEQ